MPACDHFRVHARRRADFRVIVRCPGSAWQRDARIVDLGLGGACLQVGESRDPGTEVSIEVHAPTLWDPLMLAGTIVWTRQDAGASKMGIRFDHRTAAQLFALFELLSAQAFDL